ncbi:MAG: hypothetical protein K5770_03335 [Lachnospiraceae bacterium]|nr:hypothetical protein [Lachnospiraceae bacterium]
MPIERKKIVKPYLLLCEGKDAENFLINYLESEALTQDQRFSNEIQVLDFGGNDDLDRFLVNLKNMERFDQVTSIAIIRDAEKDFAKACSDVTRSLRKSGIVSPGSYGTWVNDDTGVNVGYLLFPLNNEAGTLEDLCLNILSESNIESILYSIDTFLTTMESFYGRSYHRKHKNRLHTYLSSSDEYVSMQLGLASKAGAFNWDSVYLEPLKRFLTEGFKARG